MFALQVLARVWVEYLPIGLGLNGTSMLCSGSGDSIYLQRQWRSYFRQSVGGVDSSYTKELYLSYRSLGVSGSIRFNLCTIITSGMPDLFVTS